MLVLTLKKDVYFTFDEHDRVKGVVDRYPTEEESFKFHKGKYVVSSINISTQKVFLVNEQQQQQKVEGFQEMRCLTLEEFQLIVDYINRFNVGDHLH